MSRPDGYFHDTRHPWPCLLFLLPLLIAYEVGVIWLGGAQPEALRNGVDAWLRWALVKFGVRQLHVLPAFIAMVFLVWSLLRRQDRPRDLMGALLGMTLESVVFALVLYAGCACLNPVLFPQETDPIPEGDSTLQVPSETMAVEDATQQVVMFVGAGIYEEAVFRLVLFSTILGLMRLMLFPTVMAAGVAALVSAAAFAAVHHVGPYGEPFESSTFLFRLLAGLYFAVLFQLRGFGVAVGAHACYDLLAGFSANF